MGLEEHSVEGIVDRPRDQLVLLCRWVHLRHKRKWSDGCIAQTSCDGIMPGALSIRTL